MRSLKQAAAETAAHAHRLWRSSSSSSAAAALHHAATSGAPKLMCTVTGRVSVLMGAKPRVQHLASTVGTAATGAKMKGKCKAARQETLARSLRESLNRWSCCRRRQACQGAKTCSCKAGGAQRSSASGACVRR